MLPIPPPPRHPLQFKDRRSQGPCDRPETRGEGKAPQEAICGE